MALNDEATDPQDLIADAPDAGELNILPVPMIFVFGSNELGKHGGGAARVAADQHGAVYGQGFGPQGDSFAIPTVAKPTGQPGAQIEEAKLRYYVEAFLLYAAHHPELTFQITQIGCGLAGWAADVVAPMFIDAPANCQFDTAWEQYLPSGQTYWGHV